MKRKPLLSLSGWKVILGTDINLPEADLPHKVQFSNFQRAKNILLEINRAIKVRMLRLIPVTSTPRTK